MPESEQRPSIKRSKAITSVTGDETSAGRAVHDHAGVPVGAHAHQDVVRVLHALADPTRLSLVHLLADGAQRVVDLTGALGLAQSTISAHLSTLRSAGLVVATPEGRATRYALADPELDELLGAAERVVARTGGSRWGTRSGPGGPTTDAAPERRAGRPGADTEGTGTTTA